VLLRITMAEPSRLLSCTFFQVTTTILLCFFLFIFNSSLIFMKNKEKENLKNFPSLSISNPESIEPNSLFRIDCNTTIGSRVQWYQSNVLIRFSNEDHFLNWTKIDESIYLFFFLNALWIHLHTQIDLDNVRHSLFIKGLSLSSELLKESFEVNYLCSSTNSFGTIFAETAVLLRSKYISFHISSFIYRSALELFWI